MIEVARRGERCVKWPTFQAGGEKEKRELPRDSQQPPIVAGRMMQRGRYRTSDGKRENGVREKREGRAERQESERGGRPVCEVWSGGWNEVERGVQGKGILGY